MAYTKPRSNSQGIADNTGELSQLGGRPGYTVLVKDIGIFEWSSVGPANGTDVFAGKEGFWSKVNEGAEGSQYKVYTASLVFSAGAVTATVYKNTIGDGSGDGVNDIGWTTAAGATYNANMTGSAAFTDNKTWVSSSNYIASSLAYNFYGYRASDNIVQFRSIRTSTNAFNAGDGSSVFIEIRVYP
jgi:hypothetical protein